MSPASLLHALTLTNHFTCHAHADRLLFREAGLELYYGSTWVVGPGTFRWICRQRGWEA